MNYNLKTKIIELRKEGLTYNEITNKLNCAKSTVSYHCSKLNNLKLNFGNEISENDINLVIKLRKQGKTNITIRKITKINKEKIIKICKNNKLKPYNYYLLPTDEEILMIQKKYDELKNLDKLHSYFKNRFSHKTIRKNIKLINRPKKEISERKKDVVRNVMNWRKNVKLKLIEYKGGKCEVETCKYNKSVWSMSFHHQDPKEKDFSISGKSYSFERLKKEVDKCVLLCGNCHGEVHEEIYEKGYSDIINKIINKNCGVSPVSYKYALTR